MASHKIFINWCLIVCAIYGAVSSGTKAESGKCECAAFSSEDQMIFSHNPMNTTCNKEGRNICLSLCTNLALISKDRAAELICQHLEHADKIKPMMFTKVCDNNWNYANITAEKPICCHEGESIPCEK